MPAVEATKVLIHSPSEALKPFVKRLLVVESTAPHRDTHLPDTGFVAAFCFAGECRLEGGASAPQAAITGLWESARSHEHSRTHAVVIASFTPTGAAAFLRRPLEEFSNVTADLRDVLEPAAGLNHFSDQLSATESHTERIRLVEDLVRRCVDGRGADPLVSAAVTFVEKTRGMMRIEELVRRIGLSQSALERRFRRIVGVSPRKFASLVRLQNVVRLRKRGVDLTTIAHEAGYSDQSHFVKDFKRFTGLAPRSFFGH